METVVFHNREKREVREALNKMVVLQLHCDHKDKEKKNFALDLQEKLTGNPAQPQYVVFDVRRDAVLAKWAYSVDHAFWLRQLADAAASYRSATP